MFPKNRDLSHIVLGLTGRISITPLKIVTIYIPRHLCLGARGRGHARLGGARSSTGTGQTLLADDPQTTDQNDKQLQAENDAQGDHGTNDAGDGLGHATARVGAGADGRAVVVAQGGRAAGAGRVPAGLAPVRLRVDGKLVHAGHEIGPRQGGPRAAEQGELGGLAGVAGRAVVEVEADADLVGGGERGARDAGVGHELPHEAGRVVRHAEKVGVHGREVGEAKVRHHAAVRAELDVELVLALVGDGAVEGVDDLCGEDGGRDGADGLGFVVGQAELVLVGPRAQLEEGLGGKEVRIGEVFGRVVDAGDVEEVEDGVGVLEAGLLRGEGAVDHGFEAIVEGLGAIERGEVAGTVEVVVRADLGVGAVGRALEPGRVLAVGAGRDGPEGDQLETVQW